LQENTESIDRYKSKWKAMHIFFKLPAEGPNPQLLLPTKIKKILSDLPTHYEISNALGCAKSVRIVVAV